MAREIFVDTSGFYAVLVSRDNAHDAALALLQEAQAVSQTFLSTDYVLDETATLLKARGHAHLLREFFDRVLSSSACRITWTDSVRFDKTRRFFLKHRDQHWSFTDCVSFTVMKELRLKQALTKDSHFTQAGFERLLPG